MDTGKTAEIGDNFKEIIGIGPSTERRLREAGIVTYEQLSQKSPEELVSLLPGMVGLTEERIKEQNWIGQAKKLSTKTAEERIKNGLHHAAFTVELMLSEENDVRRMKVVYVQKQKRETWTGWDKERLVKFIALHAGLESSEEFDDEVEVKHAAPEQKSNNVLSQANLAQTPASGNEAKPMLTDIGVVVVDSNISQQSKVIPIEEDWGIQVKWSLQGLDRLPLDGRWIVQVHLESMGKAPEYDLLPVDDVWINETNVLIEADPQNRIEPGVYRMVVSITGETATGTPLPVAAYKDGGLVQFYSLN